MPTLQKSHAKHLIRAKTGIQEQTTVILESYNCSPEAGVVVQYKECSHSNKSRRLAHLNTGQSSRSSFGIRLTNNVTNALGH